jgi:hypothetical protein
MSEKTQSQPQFQAFKDALGHWQSLRQQAKSGERVLPVTFSLAAADFQQATHDLTYLPSDIRSLDLSVCVDSSPDPSWESPRRLRDRVANLRRMVKNLRLCFEEDGSLLSFPFALVKPNVPIQQTESGSDTLDREAERSTPIINTISTEANYGEDELGDDVLIEIFPYNIGTNTGEPKLELLKSIGHLVVQPEELTIRGLSPEIPPYLRGLRLSYLPLDGPDLYDMVSAIYLNAESF